MRVTAITRFKQGDLWLALKRLGWSQSEFARRCGCNNTTIGNCLNLRVKPSREMADKMQRVLAEAGEFIDVLGIWPEQFTGLKRAIQIEQTRDIELVSLENAMEVPAIEDRDDRDERGELLNEAIESLDDRDRAFMEQIRAGKSQGEIAERLGIGRAYVKTRKNIVFRKVRKLYVKKLARRENPLFDKDGKELSR